MKRPLTFEEFKLLVERAGGYKSESYKKAEELVANIVTKGITVPEEVCVRVIRIMNEEGYFGAAADLCNYAISKGYKRTDYSALIKNFRKTEETVLSALETAASQYSDK